MCTLKLKSLQSSVKTKSPKEVMEIFLQKNLQMLHSCHEKYALDFEDSDEDDNTNSHKYALIKLFN